TIPSSHPRRGRPLRDRPPTRPESFAPHHTEPADPTGNRTTAALPPLWICTNNHVCEGNSSMSKKIIGRALGAGFALATATALVLPGVASAADGEEGAGWSLGGLTAGSSDLLPGLDTIQCIFDNVGSAGAEEEADEEESIDFSAILECFTGGSSGDGDNGGDDDGDGETA